MTAIRTESEATHQLEAAMALVDALASAPGGLDSAAARDELERAGESLRAALRDVDDAYVSSKGVGENG